MTDDEPERRPRVFLWDIRETTEIALLAALKRDAALFDELRPIVERRAEDVPYRMYHVSWKVFYVQSVTLEMVALLRGLLPDFELDSRFREIIEEGTGHTFEGTPAEEFTRTARRILEAFWHAKYMFDAACKHRELEAPPRLMPSSWAGLLYLFGVR